MTQKSANMSAAPAYAKLVDHAQKTGNLHLKDLLTDATRTDDLTFDHGGITLDFSRQNATSGTLPLLVCIELDTSSTRALRSARPPPHPHLTPTSPPPHYRQVQPRVPAERGSVRGL